jgi:hypothetical protein
MKNAETGNIPIAIWRAISQEPAGCYLSPSFAGLAQR